MDRSPQSNSLIYELHKTVWILDKLADRTLQQQLQLTYPQFLMLLAIAQHETVSQRVVADFLELTPGAVSRHIEILRERELLVREENLENRREHRLHLTESGKLLFKKAKAILDQKYTELLPDLAPEKQKQLEEVLGLLRKNICALNS